MRIMSSPQFSKQLKLLLRLSHKSLRKKIIICFKKIQQSKNIQDLINLNLVKCIKFDTNIFYAIRIDRSIRIIFKLRSNNICYLMGINHHILIVNPSYSKYFNKFRIKENILKISSTVQSNTNHLDKRYVNDLYKSGWPIIRNVTSRRKIEMCKFEEKDKAKFNKKLYNKLIYNGIINKYCDSLENYLDCKFNIQIQSLKNIINSHKYAENYILMFYVLFPVLEHILLQKHLILYSKKSKFNNKIAANEKKRFRKKMNKDESLENIIRADESNIIYKWYGGNDSKKNKYNRNNILHGKVNPINIPITKSIQLLLLCCDLSHDFPVF